MVNKSFQPIQLTFTWSTGQMHPNKKGYLAPEWKHANQCRELFWVAVPVQAGRANLCVLPRGYAWLPLATRIQMPLWGTAGSDSQAIIPSQVRLKSYRSILVVLSIHLPGLPSLAWPKRTKVVGKQETVEMRVFYENKNPTSSSPIMHQFQPMVLLSFYTHW